MQQKEISCRPAFVKLPCCFFIDDLQLYTGGGSCDGVWMRMPNGGINHAVFRHSSKSSWANACRSTSIKTPDFQIYTSDMQTPSAAEIASISLGIQRIDQPYFSITKIESIYFIFRNRDWSNHSVLWIAGLRVRARSPRILWEARRQWIFLLSWSVKKVMAYSALHFGGRGAR